MNSLLTKIMSLQARLPTILPYFLCRDSNTTKREVHSLLCNNFTCTLFALRLAQVRVTLAPIP